MSWSLRCCKCKNEKYEFFELLNHKPYTDIKELNCMVCKSELIHEGYGSTRLKDEPPSGPSASLPGKPIDPEIEIKRLMKRWGKKKIDRYNYLISESFDKEVAFKAVEYNKGNF